MADDYIRRQDILNAVEKLDIIPSVDGMGIPTDTEDFRVQFLGTVLKVEPADVVPVVRCKDCKYMVFTPKAPNKARPGETHPDFYHCYKYRQFHPLIKPDSDFCSYGERREE